MKDKVVVITGASQGIGKCLATQLAKQGARVILLARSVEKLQFIEKDLRERQCNVKAIPVDLTSISQIENAFKQIAKDYQKIDILINNAAVGLFTTVKDSNLEDAKTVFNTNFFAPLLIIQQTLPLMKEHGGKIVNISSAISKHASGLQGIYAASKSSLDRLSEALQIEENNIKVLSIYIDRTKTNFKDNMVGPKDNYVLPFKGLSSADPEEVARKIIFAIQNSKFIYHTSLKSKLFSLGAGIAPSFVNSLFSKQYKKNVK